MRVRLEDGLKLDMNKLLRDGFGKGGEQRMGSITWTRIPYGEVVASGTIAIDIRSTPFGWLTLALGRFQQRIQLHAAWRNFGGCQWYFICPVTGRDASVLWLPPGASRFQSRQSWGRQVAYGSQFQTWHDRALTRAQDIRYRLGGKEYISLLESLPLPKPKGMHWRTYQRKIQRCEACEDACLRHIRGFLRRYKH